MPQISLTDFVDIVSKSGTPKTTKVREVKDRPEYGPVSDFYKSLRERIVEVHRENLPKHAISEVLDHLTDPKKKKNYPDRIEGYKKWWGKKNLVWFTPPRDHYKYLDFEISVNPELGLVINGKRHVIKLYFKLDPLSKFRVTLITDLMEHQLRAKAGSEDIFAVLDIPNSKLFVTKSDLPNTLLMVRGEIAYIATVWNAEEDT